MAEHTFEQSIAKAILHEVIDTAEFTSDIEDYIDEYSTNKVKQLNESVTGSYNHRYEQQLTSILIFLAHLHKERPFSRIAEYPHGSTATYRKTRRIPAKHRIKIGYYAKPFLVKVLTDAIKRYLINTPNVWDIYRKQDVYPLKVPKNREEYLDYLLSLVDEDLKIDEDVGDEETKENSEDNQSAEPKGS